MMASDSDAVASNVGMVFGAAIIVTALAAIYAAASGLAAAKVPVDDGNIWAALVVAILLIDFYSDITFAIHLGAYFSAEDDGSGRRRLSDGDGVSDEMKFKGLLVAAVTFMVLSYLA